jgi:lysophospholipase L1-like esterase
MPDIDATSRDRAGKSEDRLSRPIVSEVDVLADHRGRVVVTLGDSITDGVTDPQTGERGWPSILSARLSAHGISVVNAGIGGNRLLQTVPVYGRNALARLNQDVFSVPNVTDLIVLEGINDIGMSGCRSWFHALRLVKTGELTAALLQISTRAHQRGVRVIAATLGPFEGASYYAPEKESVRQAYNAWIRSSKALDGFIDFDKVLRDPQQPLRLQAQYDSGDHLHPSAAGYRAMGESITLSLFN